MSPDDVSAERAARSAGAWVMSPEDERALERVLEELREAIGRLPPLTHSVPAQQLMLDAFQVGINDKAKWRLGYEVCQMLNARVAGYVALESVRRKDG